MVQPDEQPSRNDAQKGMPQWGVPAVVLALLVAMTVVVNRSDNIELIFFSPLAAIVVTGILAAGCGGTYLWRKDSSIGAPLVVPIVLWFVFSCYLALFAPHRSTMHSFWIHAIVILVVIAFTANGVSKWIERLTESDGDT